MPKHCIKCKKELPDGVKMPICKYHCGIVMDKAIKVGTPLATVLVALIGVNKKDEIEATLKEKSEKLRR